MEATGIALIKEQIAKEQAALRSAANKLEGELAAIESQLERLSAALASLTVGVGTVASKSRPERKRTNKPAASKAEVIRHLHAVLASAGVLEEAELRATVEGKVLEAGFSRMGLALRLKEALLDPALVETPAGLRLRSMEDQLEPV